MVYTRDMAVASASKCNCDDTVRYDGREKNSCGLVVDPSMGAIRNASPAPSQSLDVRIGVWV